MTNSVIVVLLAISTIVGAIGIVPQPKNQEFKGDGTKLVDLSLLECFDETLIRGFIRFEDKLSQSRNISTTDINGNITGDPLTELKFDVKDIDAQLQFEVDESYSLTIEPQSPTVTIQCGTKWGCLHGLSTLQQMIVKDGYTLKVELAVKIEDEPLLPHRGILFDSARNFLPVDILKTSIDLMAMNKINVFHWHVVDSASWPLYIETYPELTQGAYSPQEIYYPDDVEELITYAMERGVRVIPEFDLPGHSNAGYKQLDPELVVCTGSGKDWQEVAAAPPSGQLNLMNDKVYQVISNIIKEVVSRFPDNYIHVGHDELNPACFNESQTIVDWYEEGHNFTDLIQYWVNNSLPFFLDNPATKLIMWEDILTSENATIPQDRIILQNWLDPSHIKDITSQGYDVIVSTKNYLYLDCGMGNWALDYKDFTDSCDPYKSWQMIYDFDIYENLTATERSHVKGAEVALWGEMTDEHNLLQTMWPRGLSFAEVSWTGKGSLGEFAQRLLPYRDYVVELGYSMGPFMPRWCVADPTLCGINY